MRIAIQFVFSEAEAHECLAFDLVIACFAVRSSPEAEPILAHGWRFLAPSNYEQATRNTDPRDNTGDWRSDSTGTF